MKFKNMVTISNSNIIQIFKAYDIRCLREISAMVGQGLICGRTAEAFEKAREAKKEQLNDGHKTTSKTRRKEGKQLQAKESLEIPFEGGSLKSQDCSISSHSSFSLSDKEFVPRVVEVVDDDQPGDFNADDGLSHSSIPKGSGKSQ